MDKRNSVKRKNPMNQTVKKRTKRPITTFTINNDFELNYDDYKEYSAKHQLDDVTNNPKIRSLFAR